MASESTRGRLSGWGLAVPADSLLVLGLLAVAVWILLARPSGSVPVRAVVGFPLLFVLPGYALVSSLFPRRRRTDERHARRGVWLAREPSTIERFALGYGLSVALLPVVALVLVETVGLSVRTVVWALAAVALLGTLVGAVRRLRLPHEQRYDLPLAGWAASGRSMLAGGSTRETALSVSVVVLLLVATSTLGYALVVPTEDESYSELLLLTESDDGEYVAGDFPDELGSGEEGEVVARVTNQEGGESRYTLVVQSQTVDRDDGLEVTDRAELEQASTTLADGEQWHYDHELSGASVAGDRRVVYLLYRGDPPADPAVDNAYRHAHLWIEDGSS